MALDDKEVKEGFEDIVEDWEEDFQGQDVPGEEPPVGEQKPLDDQKPSEEQKQSEEQKTPEGKKYPEPLEPQKQSDVASPQPEPPKPIEPPKPPITPEQAKERRVELIKSMENSIEIPDDDLEALGLDPDGGKKLLRNLAAQATVTAFEATLSVVRSIVPQMLEEYTTAKSLQEKYRSEFFEKWPSLNKPEYQQTIRQVAQMFGSLFPNATPEQAIQAIGSQVALMVGATPQPTPSVQPPKPFSPASPGGSGANRPAGAPTNIFDELLSYEESLD